MIGSVLAALAAIALAVGLDLLVGEPPTRLHPVAWFGRAVGLVDREWTRSIAGQRAAGLVVALVLPLAAAAIVWAVVAAAAQFHPAAIPVAAGVALFLTTSLRALLELARSVVADSEADPDGARESVRGLVGRDATTLSPAELRSAAAESASENLADGLVAPLLAFAVVAPLSLPLAAAAAAWVKAVNTLDSMLGYPANPHGTASARLDDAVMWLPARASALVLALSARDPGSLRRARRYTDGVPSPNSGWPMATLSCALGVRLEKPGVYDLNPEASLPTVADGERAVALVGRAGVLAIGLAALVAVGVATVLALDPTGRLAFGVTVLASTGATAAVATTGRRRPEVIP